VTSDLYRETVESTGDVNGRWVSVMKSGFTSPVFITSIHHPSIIAAQMVRG